MASISSILDKNMITLIGKLGYLLNPLVLRIRGEKGKLLVYYFHGLYESEEQKQLNHVDPQNNITTAQLSDFIEYFLKKRFKFINIGNLSEEITDYKPRIMITFDDGYYNNALSIKVLEKYQVPATFFITTKNVVEGKSYWWDIIYKYRIKEGVSAAEIHKEQVSLKKLKSAEIEEYILTNFGPESFSPWSDIDRPFTPEELSTVAKNNLVSIGNHTHTHAILTNYNESEIESEFSESNRILTEILGNTPVSCAFPNGNVNEKVLKVAQKSGFSFVFTTKEISNLLMSVKTDFQVFDRYMPRVQDVKSYASFNRLDYNPVQLYYELKDRLLLRKKINGNSSI